MTWDELVSGVVAALDPGMGRVMREWVLVPETQSARRRDLVEQAV